MEVGEIDLLQNQLHVRYDPRQTDLDGIMQTVLDQGFQATELEQ